MGRHRHGEQLPEVIGYFGFTIIDARDAGLQQHNAEHRQVAELEAYLEKQLGAEGQQHEQGGHQAVEHIRVAAQHAPDRDEREHRGRARHRRGKPRDVGIEPDGEHQEQGLEEARGGKQLQRLEQEAEDHKDDAHVHSRHTEDVADPCGGVRGPQFGLHRVVVAQQYGPGNGQLAARHPRRGIACGELLLHIVRQGLERIGGAMPQPLPAVGGHKACEENPLALHIAAGVERIGVGRRIEVRQRGGNGEHIAITDGNGLRVGALHIQQHLAPQGNTPVALPQLGHHLHAARAGHGMVHHPHHKPATITQHRTLLRREAGRQSEHCGGNARKKEGQRHQHGLDPLPLITLETQQKKRNQPQNDHGDEK